MENNAELVRLEQLVDTLLEKYNELKEKAHFLEETLRERDEECADLKTDLAELKDEHLAVGSRVSDLLGRIEQWESEQDDPSSEEDTVEDTQDDQSSGENTVEDTQNAFFAENRDEN